MNRDSSLGGTPPSVQDTARNMRAARWAGIPHDLRDRPQWVLAAPDKSPRKHTGARASVIDPATWCSFNTAAHAGYDRGWHIGFVLHESDPFTCIDFDVVDAESQQAKRKPVDRTLWTTQRAMDQFWIWVQGFGSYAEVSRSGKGLHVWCRGKIGNGIRKQNVEWYSQERYIICTGWVALDNPIVAQQDVLNQLVAEIDRDRLTTICVQLIESPRVESDEVVWHKARRNAGKNAEKFDSLWRGEWPPLGYPSQSEADHALLGYFAHATHSDAQVRSIFRMSGLGRRKKAQRDDYLNRSLQRHRATQALVAQMQAGWMR